MEFHGKFYEMKRETFQKPCPFFPVLPSSSPHPLGHLPPGTRPLPVSTWSTPSSYMLLDCFIALSTSCIILFISLHESLVLAYRRILAQSWHSVTICWMNEGMNKWMNIFSVMRGTMPFITMLLDGVYKHSNAILFFVFPNQNISCNVRVCKAVWPEVEQTIISCGSASHQELFRKKLLIYQRPWNVILLT